MIKFTNEGDCITTETLTGRGVSFVAQNLAGENCYSLTAKAKEKVTASHQCFYQNGNDEWTEML